MRSRFWSALVALIIPFSFVLTGCSLASEGDLAGIRAEVAKIACSDVRKTLDEAEMEAMAAKEAAEDAQSGHSKPTPATEQAKRASELADAKVEALKERLGECADTAQSSPQSGDTSCPAEFVQVTPDRGDQGRFVADGVKSAEEAMRIIRTDGVSLRGAALAFGFDTPPLEDLLTPDKKCLSSTGQALYYQVVGVMTARGTVVNDNDTAPSHLTNSGVNDGDVVYENEPGLFGDLPATSWTWTGADGEQTAAYMLHRCGNWPVEKPSPIVPKGKTDNPPKPTSNEPEQPASKTSVSIPDSPGSYSESPTRNPVTGSTAPESQAPTGASTVDNSGTSKPAPSAPATTQPSAPSTTQAPGASPGTGNSGVTNTGTGGSGSAPPPVVVDQGGDASSDVDPD